MTRLCSDCVYAYYRDFRGPDGLPGSIGICGRSQNSLVFERIEGQQCGPDAVHFKPRHEWVDN